MLYITRFAADWRFYAALSLGVIFSICLHEFCHAWVALRQGDPTAADRGHLTLNPLKQMGLWSLIMFAMVGIAWGQVPVNPGRMRHRWSPALVAASGPLANLGLFCIFAAVTAFLYLAGNEQPCAVRIFLHIAMMNSILVLLNMLPVDIFSRTSTERIRNGSMGHRWSCWSLFLPDSVILRRSAAR